ncbi:unnamed protein product [Microthlaspi erraticum]|uniref:F-box domain-containing protein n=1 Tax=Microthlaspi erraticum TaxID=1685480 RepID=A0A6D2KBK3_9BRAS|nr:unnamed protein product [Microthlaspi erraticum]
MTKLTDLSGDMVSEILSRVSLTSLTAVRSTCKTWNDSSKNQVLGEKGARKKQFVEFMIQGSIVYSLRFNLQGVRNDKDENDFIYPSMKEIRIPNNQGVKFYEIYHCDGLLLCVPKGCPSRILVWNPYLGQTRWIRVKVSHLSTYALGYGHDGNNNNRNHKILRMFYDYRNKKSIEVYDFHSDSWRFIDFNQELFHRVNDGVSLKGNAYLLGNEFLVCFDFTRERCGPRLPLPVPSVEHHVILSWVRDEKLLVLFTQYDKPEMIEVWISVKVEPNAISWSSFLRLDMRVVNGLHGTFFTHFYPKSFVIDEEKKVVVLFDLERCESRVHSETNGYQMAYIVGEDGYLRSFNMGVSNSWIWGPSARLVCSSYVPSLVQLHINRPKRKK